MNVSEAIENIYGSLAEDNKDLDLHIANLKTALKDAGEKEAVIEPSRLFQNNREGRKMMQAYFKRKGVKIKFKD